MEGCIETTLPWWLLYRTAARKGQITALLIQQWRKTLWRAPSVYFISQICFMCQRCDTSWGNRLFQIRRKVFSVTWDQTSSCFSLQLLWFTIIKTLCCYCFALNFWLCGGWLWLKPPNHNTHQHAGQLDWCLYNCFDCLMTEQIGSLNHTVYPPGESGALLPSVKLLFHILMMSF